MTRASTILFWFALTILVSLGLYHTSYRTEELGRTLRSLNAQIEAQQRSIHVLKAEYVFLTNPARIETAARKHLADLQPTQPKQIAKLTRLAELVPTRHETLGSAMVEATPIATLRARAAAHSPRAVAEEVGRVNTRLVIGKTASAQPLPAMAPASYELEDSADQP